jgi:hypothetical protein
MTSRSQLRFVALVFMAASVFVSRIEAADGVGKVCVQKISVNTRWDANDTGAREGSTFTVQIDDLPAITVTTNSSGVFTNLSLAKKHLVKIKLDGKALTSFRFTFQERGDHLRLWYKPFYGTWSLSDVSKGEKCACPKVEPSNLQGWL